MKSYPEKKLITTLYILIRILSYSLCVLLLSELIRYDAGSSLPGHLFSEDSLTEKAQSAMLSAATCIFLWCAIKRPATSTLSITLFCFTAASLIREQDIYLDEWLFHGSWKIGAFGLVGLAILVVIRQFGPFLLALNQFSKNFVFGLMLSGIITTYLFSRMMGRKIFWLAVMGERYFRDVKNAAEESLELYGYLLLLISGVEYLLFFTRSNKRSD